MREEPPSWMERLVPIILILLTVLAITLIGVAVFVILQS